MSKIFEVIETLDKNGNSRKMRQEIINPTNSEKWFYFIQKKDILSLENMIKKGSNINQIDTEGQTIAHHCLISKSYKLFNLCLNYNVNYNVEDIFEVNPSKIIFQKNYNIHFFKNIINKIDFKHLFYHEEYKECIFFLINHDYNLPKLKFLFTVYPEIMEPLRPQLISKALERESIETWKYLSGRGTLIERLTSHLTDKNHKAIFIKI